ncbi:MAG: protein kinase [Planctomycetes bacterium]|nr:protein kinase [Planctomycetota bacterium]
MAVNNCCSQCSAPLSKNTPYGLCPKCLMKVGFQAEVNATLDAAPIEAPGTKISSYELLELIGEGGMGLVYLAQQQEPKRKVALKIVKLGMDTKQVVARFEAERQTLALLAHPNIAHVFDAGTTDTGRPYFVMEYVEGRSITKYCDEQKLNIEQRLELFQQICEGVHHAHQKGIIHRDIKPSNILVSVHGDRAVPKIIDFGIAKAITQPLTENTSYTEHGQLLGTPEYMSPEQAEMGTEDIDTRSDIYSLGVLLYELLAGATPFDAKRLRKGGIDHIQQVICEEEPRTPSARLTSLGDKGEAVAERRRTQIITLTRRLHRELEWIPMKAMRKDRSRRYRSASELSDDIQNYLTGTPLSAGPESNVYRARKFVHKHAGSVTSAALVAVVIILGLVASIMMGCRAEQAREQAVDAQKQIEQALARAENAEKIAQEQRKLAEERAEEYRRSLYGHQITLADIAYRDSKIRRLRKLLDACPDDLRAWEWNRLNHLSDQAVMTLRGHEGPVWDVGISPDNKVIISTGSDKTIKLWDAVSGTERMTLRGHEEVVLSATFSPDGQRIASLSRDKTIKIWDAQSGVELMTLTGDDGLFTPWGGGPIAFSPDSRKIVTGSQNKEIKVWDAANGTELTTLSGSRGRISCLAFSPDGRRIVSGPTVWDLSTGQQLMVLIGHKAPIRAVAISPDGKRIVTGSADRTAKVWEMATGNELMTLRGHNAAIGSVSFSPDGAQIITAGDSGTIAGDSGAIKVWDAASGTELTTLWGHQSWINAVTFSADGQRIVSSSGDGTIKLWEPRTNHTAPVVLEGRHEGVTFSPDGKHILTGGRHITVWDAATRNELTRIDADGGSAEFSPDCKRIIAADGNDIKVWEALSGKELMTLSGHERGIWSMSYSPDGTKIVSGGLDKTVRIWNADTGTQIKTLRGHGDWPEEPGYSPVSSVAFSPDGKLIASGSYDKTVKIWNATTGAEVMTMDKHSGLVSDVAFSPDGTRFASAGDGTIRVCDVATGNELLILRGHQGEALTVAFSPDGQRIVSGSKDATVRIWDAATGIEVQRLSVSNKVWDLAFSPDGKTLAAVSGARRSRMGRTVTLWESARSTSGRVKSY